jgi:hypothetical protein
LFLKRKSGSQRKLQKRNARVPYVDHIVDFRTGCTASTQTPCVRGIGTITAYCLLLKVSKLLLLQEDAEHSNSDMPDLTAPVQVVKMASENLLKVGYSIKI